MATPEIYHEKQKWQLCALHALNNLFQEEKFTKANFDKVCMELSPEPLINPHRSILGVGNYDINVIIKLLADEKLGNERYDAIWYNRKKNPDKLCLSQIHGFILNIPSNIQVGCVPLPIRCKHWIAVRCIGGIFYNLDSDFDVPEPIGTDVALKKFLKDQISDVQVYLFIVVTKAVAKARSWEEAEPLQGRNLDKLCLSQIHGFILNIPSKINFGYVQLPVPWKHWIAVRCIGGIFYNLNSKFDAPRQIGTDVDLKKFIKDQISDVQVHLFIVVTKAVAKARSWEEAEPLQGRSDWYLRRKQDCSGFELKIRPRREE